QILGEDARPPKSRQSLVNRFPLANRGRLMLETARTGRFVGSLQGCSSAGRVPVSKTGCRRFEPCRPCQFNPLIPNADRPGLLSPCPGLRVVPYLDLSAGPQYIAATCCRPVLTDIRRGFENPRTIEP